MPEIEDGMLPLETPSFGARRFVITDQHVNKLINIIGRLEGHEVQSDAIDLLKKMQEHRYEEGSV